MDRLQVRRPAASCPLPVDRVENLLRRVAAHGLPGATPPGDGADLSAAQWSRLLIRIAEERLFGCFASALSAGELASGPWGPDRAREAAYDSLRLTMPLLELLSETVEILTRADVEVRVLKGAALAQLDYPASTLRSYIDVDLLVRPRDFDRALAAMVRAGHGRRGLPERRPGFDRRFCKDVTLITASGRGIDLHRTLTLGPFGQTIRIDDLWSDFETFEVKGRPLRALSTELRLLNVCFHAALGGVPVRLVPLRDVAQMITNGRLDLQRVRELAGSWKADMVLARALQLAEQNLEVSLGELGAWARCYRPAPWEERALSQYVANVHPGLERSLETVKLVQGWGRKLRYAHAYAFPSRIYLEGRYSGYVEYWHEHLRARLAKRGQ